jgi:hypothetical protein
VFVSFGRLSYAFENYLLDKTSCLAVEEGLCGGRTQGSRGSFESSDVVVGGEVVRGSTAIDSIGLGRCESGT